MARVKQTAQRRGGGGGGGDTKKKEPTEQSEVAVLDPEEQEEVEVEVSIAPSGSGEDALSLQGAGANAALMKKRKKRRAKQGTKALREIKRLQKSTDPVIPFASISRLAREIAHQYVDEVRFEREAVEAIRVAAEDYLEEVMKGSHDLAIGLGFKTLQSIHMQCYLNARNNTSCGTIKGASK